MRKLRPPVPRIYHVATRTVDKREFSFADD
jgi:hypothetical protein